MAAKYLITICLLLSSLYVSAQPAEIGHLYGDANHNSSYETSHAQGFNDRFISPPKKQWLQLAEQSYISKAQAIDIAKQRTDGKILSAKLIQREQQAFYKIKVLTDQGRIKTVRVNAKRH